MASTSKNEDELSQPTTSDETPANPTGKKSSKKKSKTTLFPFLPDVTYNWVDITQEFTECCKDLELGELLHDSSFGLFEAMTAIEMMDPKMDAGLLCNRGDHKVLNFDQAVEANKLKLDGFLEGEIISIIDTTFSCLVSWLEGHSLAQTVFTNLYMQKPFEIRDKTLKIFSVTIFKILENIREIIQSAGVFEEEDFQPIMYGYFLPHIADTRVQTMLKETEEELIKRTKIRDSSVQKATYFANPDLALALYVRMKTIRLFFHLFGLLGQLRRQKFDDTVPECLKTLNTINELTTVIIASIAMGSDYSGIGFEPLVNQRLLPPTFPRYTRIKPCDQAYKYLNDLTDRIRVIIKIQNQVSLHAAVDFFVDFSRTRPCVLSRSILQTLYFGSSLPGICGSSATTVLNNVLFMDVLREACKNFIAPPSLTNKVSTFPNLHCEHNYLQGKEYVNTFLLHCIRPFANMIQLYGHNHARQRDKLAHLLEELAALQDEAERVDVFLHNQYLTWKIGQPHLACYGTWLLYHTLQVMIMYLLAGFELELYSSHEYYYIYWYMYEFLYGWLISALTRAENFITWTDIHKSKSNKRNKGKKKKSSARPYEREILYYQVLQNMCGGYYKGLYALRCAGLMKLPCNEFSREPIRFEHRFVPFRTLITPPPVTYEEFLDTVKLLHTQSGDVDTSHLYLLASEHFSQARTALQSMNPSDKEISGLLKVSKWNLVVFKILAGGRTPDKKVPPEFDFSDHNLFPSIKLQYNISS